MPGPFDRPSFRQDGGRWERIENLDHFSTFKRFITDPGGLRSEGAPPFTIQDIIRTTIYRERQGFPMGDRMAEAKRALGEKMVEECTRIGKKILEGLNNDIRTVMEVEQKLRKGEGLTQEEINHYWQARMRIGCAMSHDYASGETLQHSPLTVGISYSLVREMLRILSGGEQKTYYPSVQQEIPPIPPEGVGWLIRCASGQISPDDVNRQLARAPQGANDLPTRAYYLLRALMNPDSDYHRQTRERERELQIERLRRTIDAFPISEDHPIIKALKELQNKGGAENVESLAKSYGYNPPSLRNIATELVQRIADGLRDSERFTPGEINLIEATLRQRIIGKGVAQIALLLWMHMINLLRCYRLAETQGDASLVLSNAYYDNFVYPGGYFSLQRFPDGRLSILLSPQLLPPTFDFSSFRTWAEKELSNLGNNDRRGQYGLALDVMEIIIRGIEKNS